MAMKQKMAAAMEPSWAGFAGSPSVGGPPPIRKLKPPQKRQMAINGKPVRSRLRRPNVSMV